jgi:hypothetical protein
LGDFDRGKSEWSIWVEIYVGKALRERSFATVPKKKALRRRKELSRVGFPEAGSCLSGKDSLGLTGVETAHDPIQYRRHQRIPYAEHLLLASGHLPG